jgi:ATP-dependent DNA helicase RecQ
METVSAVTSHSFPETELHAALGKFFHYPAFRPGQLDALHHILARRDTLVVMPTGSGKSLIYQLAALVQPGTALVISPLVALMKDQVDSLTGRGISATFINSSLTFAEQDKRLNAMARGQYKIVLVAPERLRSGSFRGALKNADLNLLAIDEAHCVSQWGHDFRPDYLQLGNARREFRPPVTLALTATATTRVQDDICKSLELAQPERLVMGFNRPNLYLEVLNAPNVKTKLELTREFLAAQQGAGIIYVGTRRDAEEVADFVREACKLLVGYYHAGLSNDARAETQDKFLAGDLPLVVATNAFGMGIDRPDVRFVLHYAVPGTLEAYYQEAGRAGRDGLPARATLIYSPRDTALQESFIANDSPREEDLRSVYSFVAGHSQISFGLLEQALGLREITARVALEQLESGGLLQREPFDEFNMMRVQAAPLNQRALQEIVTRTRERQNHKRRLLARMVSYAETNACRRRVILDYFGDHGTADAPLCCDNDVARQEIRETRPNQRPAATETEHIALTVLETVRAFQRKMGKGKLIDILRGSRAKDVQPFVKSPSFGKLSGVRKSDLDTLLAQLQNDGFIKQVGGEYPTLTLTPRGENALETRIAIETNIRAPKPGAMERAKAEKQAGGTVLLTGQLLAQGKTPEQIAAERGLTVGTIYSHLAQLIAERQVDVNRVVTESLQNQIRAAIDAVGSAQYLAPIKARLPEDIEYGVIRCVANAWQLERGELPVTLATAAKAQAARPPEDAQPSNSVEEFLAKPHPRPLYGPWRAGWALDFHSRFDGDTQNRGVVGELVFRYKYRGEQQLAGELAERWEQLLRSHPELPKFDAVIPVPSTSTRDFDRVATLAAALATGLKIPVIHALAKTRATQQQKELMSLAQKQANVRGAFGLQVDVRGKHIVLVDDLYDSGATLQECARVLQSAGVASIVVLTLTKTIHADR